MLDHHQALREFKTRFFEALAHPLRIEILDALRDRAHSEGALTERLEVDARIVTEQLAILHASGIVSSWQKGPKVYYHVKDMALFELLDVAQRVYNNQLIERAPSAEDASVPGGA